MRFLENFEIFATLSIHNLHRLLVFPYESIKVKVPRNQYKKMRCIYTEAFKCDTFDIKILKYLPNEMSLSLILRVFPYYIKGFRKFRL